MSARHPGPRARHPVVAFALANKAWWLLPLLLLLLLLAAVAYYSTATGYVPPMYRPV